MHHVCRPRIYFTRFLSSLYSPTFSFAFVWLSQSSSYPPPTLFHFKTSVFHHFFHPTTIYNIPCCYCVHISPVHHAPSPNLFVSFFSLFPTTPLSVKPLHGKVDRSSNAFIFLLYPSKFYPQFQIPLPSSESPIPLHSPRLFAPYFL